MHFLQKIFFCAVMTGVLFIPASLSANTLNLQEQEKVMPPEKNIPQQEQSAPQDQPISPEQTTPALPSSGEWQGGTITFPSGNNLEIPAGKYTELSPEGAELPPVVMESAEKAKILPGKDALSALAGNWLYSRDLARKSDGESVALEFSFDQNGKGYSLIKDGSGKDFQAIAEAILTPDGTIRVKTDAYTNGSGQGYYPTFMECRKKSTPELWCDVSNGWTHVNDGMLLSKDSVDEQNKRMNMEELLPVAPPKNAPQNSDPEKNAENEDESALLATLLGDMASDAQKHSEPAKTPTKVIPPAQESKPTPSPVSPKIPQTMSSQPSPAKNNRLVLPNNQEDDDMSFLEGHWRCNTGLSRISDNQPVVVEFRFDKNGRGTANVRELSGRIYNASAQAGYTDGKLRINTSEFRARGLGGGYCRTHIECSDHNGYALCSGKNCGINWKNATFTRLK